jgi:hypothetical protein
MANPGAVWRYSVHFQRSEHSTQVAFTSRDAARFLLAAAQVTPAWCADATGTTYFLALAAMA